MAKKIGKRRHVQRALPRRKEKQIREIVPLTPEQIAAGSDVQDVISQLNPPQEAWAKNEGGGSNPPSPQSIPDYNLLREQILRLHASGLSIPAIARRLGASAPHCSDVVSKNNVLTKEEGRVKLASLLSRQFSLTATTYTAICEDYIRRWTVIQATRDRLLGSGQPSAEALTEGPVPALHEQMDAVTRDFGRATKEYVDVIQRMGVPGAAAEREKEPYSSTSTKEFYASLPVSDKDLGELEGMMRRQIKLVQEMKKKQEKVVKGEVIAVETTVGPVENGDADEN